MLLRRRLPAPQPSPRFAVISSPRSANTWLSRLLRELFNLEAYAVHTPGELAWDKLPARAVVQLHWPRTPALVGLLQHHGFHVCVLVRHPFDLLVSILHYAGYESMTARWLDGAYGDERRILGRDPCSAAFVEYATSARARALVGVSREWWASRDTSAQLRFEDFVTRPREALGLIVEQSAVEPVIPVADALARAPFSRMQAEARNEHFWRGEPGHWRSLLTADCCARIGRPYRAHAQRFEYNLLGDPELDPETASASWRARRAPAPAIAYATPTP